MVLLNRGKAASNQTPTTDGSSKTDAFIPLASRMQRYHNAPLSLRRLVGDGVLVA